MTLQVREYATLTTDAAQPSTLDNAVVSQATFDWLLDLQQGWSGEAKLLHRDGKRRLKLGNYVGYLQSPSGEGIEILPKTAHVIPAQPDQLRALLQRMLRSSPQLHHRDASAADLMAAHQPVHEWIMGEFLHALTDLVRRGLRFDYQHREEESPVVRGQLNIARQIRQTPDKATRFHIRYADFSPQRVENRLLRSALDSVFTLTRNNAHWRQANTLRHQLADLQPHPQPARALPRWQDSKTLTAYRAVKPWCELILNAINPHFQRGAHRGIALLFPMEKLYENYLDTCLRLQLQPGLHITAQANRHAMVRHCPVGAEQSVEWFRLRPDFLVQGGKQNLAVIDAKWKLLDSTKDKYNISQSDVYQMFAYGERYLGGQGDVVLAYPSHGGFQATLPVFHFSDALRLWVVPFDLHRGELQHTGELSGIVPPLQQNTAIATPATVSA